MLRSGSNHPSTNGLNSVKRVPVWVSAYFRTIKGRQMARASTMTKDFSVTSTALGGGGGCCDRLRRCVIPIRGDNYFEGDRLGTWKSGSKARTRGRESGHNECLNRTQQVEAGRFAYLLHRRGAALRAPWKEINSCRELPVCSLSPLRDMFHSTHFHFVSSLSWE